MDHAFRTQSIFRIAAIIGCMSAALSGCGGGDEDSASASTPSSNNTPAVTPPATPAPSSTSNKAPAISGNAITAVQANSTYSFVPVASDADGDTLAFQIQNKPSWATFDTLTGKLSGTPTIAHAGDYENIAITVNDGTASAALSAFAISVTTPTSNDAVETATLSWSAPTQNEDGTTLSNLAGYTIHYGVTSETLDKSIRVENPGIDRYVMDGLPAGTYYFGVRAFTSSGIQSTMSNIVSRVVN
jgi:Putative Ig domain